MLDGSLDKILGKISIKWGETCVDGDQDVISEEGQGGRCNELVKKNQSSMLYVLDAKNSVGIICLQTRRQHHRIRGRIHPKWGRLVMSPFLELEMGHRRFNRNETALVQIMGIDREQAVTRMDHEETKSRFGNRPRVLVRLN